MAQQFNLTAQINLQSPKNVGRVVSDIQRQLKGSGLNTVNIKVKADPRSMAQTNKQLQNISRNSKSASKDINTLNRSLQEATRRFSVITLATGTLLSFVTGFKNATKAAIEFERELIKISQVTGKSVQQLQGLTREVTKLSTSLGVSSSDLLNVSRTLSQAGFSAEKTRKALDILAKTSLGATFTSIQDTTEGAIALLRQFGNEARKAGGDIKFLEQSLDAINAVSKRFAVESDDLITVIRRVGGVFSAAGGEVNELIALFTSVRSTTRESAETIATGLRTIFTRIQRPETINQLRELGIELQDAQGNFVGAFEAVKRLSQGLNTLDPRSAVFSQIVEDLGGFRQIGKVIPLIQQFATAQKALAVAQGAGGSSARDALKAQAGLGVQIQKVKEEFNALIRQFSDSSTFKSVAKGALEIASAMIKVAEAVEPLLPLLTSMFALKLGRSLAPGIASMAGIARGGGGGGRGFSRFARGGMVPGQGNRDTVPAMLTPGEFVIKKSSVKSLGTDTLAQMNNNRFNVGGTALREKFKEGRPQLSNKKLGGEAVPGSIQLIDDVAGKALDSELGTYGGAFLRPIARKQKLQGFVDKKAIGAGIRNDPDFKQVLSFGAKVKGGAGKIKAKLEAQLKSIEGKSQTAQAGFVLRAGSLEKSKAEGLEDIILGGVEDTVLKGANNIGSTLTNRMSGASSGDVAKILKSANIDNVTGNIFEAILTSVGDKDPMAGKDSNSDWDYLTGLGGKLASYFDLEDVATRPTDAKSSFTSDNVKTFIKKVKNLETKKSIAEANKALDPILGAIKREISGMTAADSRSIVSGPGSSTVATRGANQQVRKMAGLNKGGGISGSDTVPAMLTPGEFVFNKSASKSIGYGNLKRMNEQGVKGYAAGGVVTTGRDFYGNGPLAGGARYSPTQALAGSGMIDSKSLQAATKQMGVFEKILAKLNQIAKQLEATFKKADTTVKRTDGDLKKMDVDIKDVAIQLDKEAQEIRESNAARDKEQAAINRSAMTRGQRVGGALQGGAQRVSRGASAVQSAAGSAQSLLFLGAMVGSVTSQMSGLNEATKTAITQTTTMVAVVGGITGTLVDVGASFVFMGAALVSQIGSAITESGASILSAGADTAEAGASSLVTAAMGPLAIAAAALAAGLLAVVAIAATFAIAMYYFSARAKAEADNFGKAAQKFIETFQETGEGLSAILKNIANQERKEEESRQFMSGMALPFASMLPGSFASSAMDMTGATRGEKQAAKDGSSFMLKTFAPALDAYFVAQAVADYQNDPEVAAAFEAQVVKNTEALNYQLLAQQSLVMSLKSFESSLNDIDLAESLTPEERVSQRLQAQKDFTNRSPGGQEQFDDLFSNILKASKEAQGNLLNRDIDPSFLKASGDRSTDSKGNPILDIERLMNLNDSDLELIPPTLRLALQTSLKNLNLALESAAKNTAESIKTLGEARQNIDVSDTSVTSFDDLSSSGLKVNQDYLKAIEASTSAIRNESILREAKLKSQLNESTDQKDRDQLQEAIDREIEGRNKLIGNIENGEKEAVNSAIKRRDADIAAAQAAEALRTRLFEAAEALQAFSDRTKGFIDDRLGIEDQAGIAQGKGSKLTATKLQAVTATTDLNQFSADAQGAISGISDPGERDQAQKAIDTQIQVAEALKVFEAPDTGLLNRSSVDVSRAAGTDIDSLMDIMEDQFGSALPDLSFLPEKVQEDIIRGIAKASAGGITQQELDNILKPIQASAEANKKITDEITKGNQEYLNAYTSYLNEVKRQYGEEIKFRNAVFQQQEQAIDREIRARNIINQSLGRDAAVQDRSAKEARRVQQAQGNLTAAGVGVAAGDIGGLTGERQRLSALSQQQGTKIRGTTDDKLRTGLAKEQSETLKQLAAVNKELERLADQSGRVDDMFAEMERNAEAIEKERAKREAVTAVVEEFVVGGQDTRKALVEAATGVRKAFASGTLQNQTEEQRSATVGFLDKLGDVELLGGFTGKEIKQELVFRDAIQMGLDPRIAEQLATATTKEQQLIDSNELLAFEINKLSGVMQAAQQGLDPANVAPALVEPQGRARGGLIYRANGGSIFQPKGTDTVPAMLTPGEFVIRKSAVDAIGTDTLAAINSGVSYLSDGSRRKVSEADREGLTKEQIKYFEILGNEGREAADAYNQQILKDGGSFVKAAKAGDEFRGGVSRPDSSSEFETYSKLGSGAIDPNRKKILNQPSDPVFDRFSAAANMPNVSNQFRVSPMATRQSTDALGALPKDEGTGALSPKHFRAAKNAGLINKNETYEQYRERERMTKYGTTYAQAAPKPKDPFQSTAATAATTIYGSDDINPYTDALGGASALDDAVAAAKNARLKTNRDAFKARKDAKRNTSTAASRKTARLSGVKSGLSGTTDQQANQARYERILRTNGPAAAQRFAKSQNFTPSGGAGAGTGRGITQAFKNNPNMMGSPQAMQQFQQFQQYQKFMKYQQQQQFRGGARFRAAGGGISGGDTVPAMLTPGEFVMSAGAVRQHGVGTMKALNRGQVKGFNKGGMVGGTQYLQDGGSATGGIDLTQISQTFDKITASITKLSTNLESLNERFGFFEMQHTVTVDGQINLPGVDGGAIAQQITDSIGGLVADEVKKALDNPEARP